MPLSSGSPSSEVVGRTEEISGNEASCNSDVDASASPNEKPKMGSSSSFTSVDASAAFSFCFLVVAFFLVVDWPPTFSGEIL